MGENKPTGRDEIKFGAKLSYVAEVGRSATEAAAEECFQSRMRGALKLVPPCRDFPITGRTISRLSGILSQQRRDVTSKMYPVHPGQDKFPMLSQIDFNTRLIARIGPRGNFPSRQSGTVFST